MLFIDCWILQRSGYQLLRYSVDHNLLIYTHKKNNTKYEKTYITSAGHDAHALLTIGPFIAANVCLVHKKQ